MTADAVPDPAQPMSRDILLDAHLRQAKDTHRIEVRRIKIVPGHAAGLHVHNGPVVGSIVDGSVSSRSRASRKRCSGPATCSSSRRARASWPARSARAAAATGQRHLGPGGSASARQLHRNRVRRHPATARQVRHQGQPDQPRHRHSYRLTAVPGLAGLPQLLMAWGNVGGPSGPSPVPGQSVSQSCTPGNDCLSSHL